MHLPSQQGTYNGSLPALNNAWGTDLSAWENITSYPTQPSTSTTFPAFTPTKPRAAWYVARCPETNVISPPLVHRALTNRWDYTEFLRFRPNDFFGWMADVIRKYDPKALLHQKTMNEPSWGDDGATGRECIPKR